MKTRTYGIGVVASALVIVALVAFARIGWTEDHGHNEHMLKCAKACSDCQRACDSCATHCAHLTAEGKKEHLTTLASCQDCATVCAAAAQICSRGGPYSAAILECCAKACGDCGAACEKFPDDKHMTACAEECRKCEASCKAMLKHMSH